MPRYYFHITDAHGTIPDEEGCDLPDLEAARGEALRTAKELAAETIKSGPVAPHRAVQVCDGTGRVLVTLPFKLISQ